MKRINKWTLLLTASYCILAVGCKDDERELPRSRNRCHPVFEQSGLFAAHHAALQRRMALDRTRRCPVALDGLLRRASVRANSNGSPFRPRTTARPNAQQRSTWNANGVQYPITVTQANGAIIYGTPTLDGNLIEGEASEARIRFTYSHAYGDETIAVKCTPSGDCRRVVGSRHLVRTDQRRRNAGARHRGYADETRIRHLRRERRRSADRRGARQGLLRQRNARRRTARTEAFQRNHGRRSRKNGSAKPSARVDDRQTYAQLRCRFGHHHGRRSRRQNRGSTELMGLQQRPCLHQRSLLQRLLADDHSGQIRRLRAPSSMRKAASADRVRPQRSSCSNTRQTA